MSSKRGQVAYEASILIVIIALLLLGYIILLPPAEREALLEEGAPSVGEDIPAAKVLLSESPGKVYSYTTNKQVLNLEPVRVFSKTEPESSVLVKSLTVSRNLLKNNFKEVLFDVQEFKDLDSARLLFLIRESKGPLTIYLNENVVYDGELDSSQLPIELPKSYLKTKGNVLRLESASTGWRIFSSNFYLLQDLTLVKVLNIKNDVVVRDFLMDTEEQKLRSAKLLYFISCNDNKNGRLTLSLNNRQVFSDLVFCEYLDEREVPLSKDFFSLSGSNTLKFEVDTGDYSIDQIRVSAELSRSSYPTYRFEVDSRLWQRIQAGSAEVSMRAVLGEGRKKSTFIINGESVFMDTSAPSYEREITDLLVNGANSLKIVPDNTFDLSSLKVYEQ